MNMKMYVITHKRTAIPELLSYVPMLVGARLNGLGSEFTCRDDEGDNISAKNKNYCELTGVYWVWKHSTADVVGICHYRRFFSRRLVNTDSVFFLQTEDVDRILSRYRMIVPISRCYAKSIIRSINYAPNLEDIKELFEGIRMCAPEYISDFLWYLQQNKAHLYNMCVMKQKDFSAYCEWLFKILAYVEAHHDMEKETDDYRKRLYGFLSERLISVWLHHNVSKDEIKEIPVVNTEETAGARIRHILGNFLRNISFHLQKNRKTVHIEEKVC